MTLPPAVELAPTELVALPDIYDYEPTRAEGQSVEWHVNFADPRLFVAYASPLLAQDELQVAEHPVLASVKEALDADGTHPHTVNGDTPTPILLSGVERRVRILLDPDPSQGRPLGLYGNRFAAASSDVIRRAVQAIDPPTITNLIAMAAPSGGFGDYAREEINYILATAATSFCAAVRRSKEMRGDDAKTIIHTGFWGCGAFGGNRILMSALQALAARIVGVNALVFHTVNRSGMYDWQDGRAFLDSIVSSQSGNAIDLNRALDLIVSKRLQWGESDGN